MRRNLLLYTAITAVQSLWITLLCAQQFGGNPPSIKWRQLKTDSVHVIYPQGADTTAFDVAAIIKALQEQNPYKLGQKFENAPIVLQTQTTNSNGYVGLGPYRSEFYLAAPTDVMDLGSIDWPVTLARHEYRHIIQYNNINRGITHTVGRVLGENARALLSDMAVPDWFFEGDAVFNETMHSSQGRGRLPRFMNVYAMLNKDGKAYGYQKLRNGSFKDYIPDHYRLGYLLVSYGYRRYGADFWGKVIRDAAQYKGLFYPFQKAVQRSSGVTFKQFRAAAFSDYLRHFINLPWAITDSSAKGQDQHLTELTELSAISPHPEKQVVNYMYPYPAELNGQPGVIALKSPRKSISGFVWLPKEGARQAVFLGQAPIARDGYFGYKAGQIIYTRYQTDPRWSYKQYSDLEILNLTSGKRTRLTHKRRYFTPDISTDGQLIVASALQTDGQSAITLLDRSGRVLRQWTAPADKNGTIFTYPKFFTVSSQGDKKGENGGDNDNDNKSAGKITGSQPDENAVLFLIRHPDGKMGIGYVRLQNDREPIAGGAGSTDSLYSQGQGHLGADAIHMLLPVSDQLLAYPVVRAEKLYYTRVRPGVTDPYTQLMELDLSTQIKAEGQLPQPVLRGEFLRDVYQGYLTAQNNTVISLQTATGYKIFNGTASMASTARTAHTALAAGVLAKNDTSGINLTLTGNSNNNQTKNFDLYLPLTKDPADSLVWANRLAGGSLNGHPDTAAVKKYGLLNHPFHFHSLQPNIEDPVYSLDLLGQNLLNTVQTKLSYSYNRVSQISAAGGDLTLGLWYLQPFVHMDYSWDHLAADSKGHGYYYKELTSQAGLQLPLSFTGGRWQRSLYLSTALSQSNLFWQQPAPAPGTALTEIRYLYSRLQLSIYGRQASQQLYPRQGISNYTEMNTPLDGKGARQWMNSTTIYLPGILSTHSLRFSLAYQHRDTAGAYGYNSRFPFSRGYVRPSFATMWKYGADYDLPVCYPDFGFGGLAYFSRIRANLYYDQSYGFDPQNKRSAFGSVGGALFADMQIGNQYPITIGLRYNRLLHPGFPQKNNWELILPIHLF